MAKPELKNKSGENVGDLRGAVLAGIRRTQGPIRSIFTGSASKFKRPKLAKPLKNRGLAAKPANIKQLPSSASAGNKFRPWLLICLSVLIVIIFAAGAATGYVYFFRPQNSLTKIFFSYLPLPVAVVNGRALSYGEWQRQTEYQLDFYQQTKKSTAESKMLTRLEAENFILQRMIDQEILRQETEKYQLIISQDDVDEYINNLVLAFGDRQALENQLQVLYHWSMDDFQRQIIRPLLLKNKLSFRLLSEPQNTQLRILAEQLKAELKKNSTRFEELAGKYNYPDAARNGGDLGYISRGQFLAEVENVAFSLNINEISDVIWTPYGFYIVKATGRLTADDGNITQVKLSQIFIPATNIDNYLAEAKNSAKIIYYISRK